MWSANLSMDDCIFCAIALKRAPASVVYQDEATVAFLDIHPIARGHTLVIPREHCPTLFELSAIAGDVVMRTVVRVASALREELAPDGLNLLQSNGRVAGQTIFHFHFHLVPRWRNDGLFLPRHALAEAPRADLTELANALRQRL
jgi:histidine triad (HIT) family protein